MLLINLDVGGSGPAFVTAGHRLRAPGPYRLGADRRFRQIGGGGRGAIFAPSTSAPIKRDHSRRQHPVKDWDPCGDLLRGRDQIIIGPAAAYAADTLAAFRRKPSDAVVSLDLLFGPFIGAKAAGVPFASLATRISLFMAIPGVLPARMDEDRAMAADVAGWLATRIDERRPVLKANRTSFRAARFGRGTGTPA